MAEEAQQLPKLQYFDIHGKAEPMRMLLFKAGAQFTDHRLQREEFAAMKESGALPSGQVPLWTDAEGRVVN